MDTELLIIDDESEIIIEVDTDVEVLEVAAQGPRGPQGIPGPAGGAASIFDSSKDGLTLSSQKTEYQTVSAGATQEIVNVSGTAGYCSSLFIAVQILTGSDIKSYADGLIKVYYDGESSPTISMPMGMFFQFIYATSGGQHANDYFGFNFGSDGLAGSYFCNLPIPFSTGLRVEITNGSGTSSLRVWSTATLHLGGENAWKKTRKLRATNFYGASLAPNSVNTFVDAQGIGAGRLVGTWMLEDDLPGALTPSGAALEGNFKIFLDGSSTPSYEASGTEDYFLLGFYGLSVPGYSWSGQVGMTFRSANITTSFYRLHVRDPIEFSNGLKITWNCGDTSQVAFTGNARVWATTYYYTEG